MTHEEYRKMVSPLLDQAHKLHMDIWAAMQAMGPDATKTAEYADLSLAMGGTSQAADLLYRARYPQPSAFDAPPAPPAPPAVAIDPAAGNENVP